MQYLVGWICVLALGMMSLVGCGDTNVTVYCGTDGAGGSGGSGGGDAFPCTEQGILDAIAEGGGPHTFACVGPTTVTTEAEIVIDNDVILDGEGNLTVDGDGAHTVFSVTEGTTAQLSNSVVTGGGGQAEASGVINRGTLTLMRATVSQNSIGGIYSSGSLQLIDSTVSDNASAEAGIQIDGDDASLVLTNSTVSGNASGISNSAGSLTLLNSTISGGVGNPSADGMLTATGSVIVGTCVDNVVISGGYNIESPGNSCGFDQTGDQPGVTAEELNLGPLADNGGPTLTHKPGDGGFGDGSAAINQIPESDCDVDTDQRGEPRPETGGTMCDVGAVEVQP
jgi:hypothetical protein